MYLLSTSTLELCEFTDSNTPKYAILSHTWGDEEISFVEMQDARDTLDHKAGFHKVKKFCTLAAACGYNYAWVDTCSIDKRSSAELSEAINSMFRYYRDAGECFIHLADVPAVEDGKVTREAQIMAFEQSRWFTRGWTLQELVAPRKRSFLCENWEPLSEDSIDLTETVAKITNISARLLKNRELLSTFCIAKRMSWASKRQVTRSEDIAYSLFGLFNISLPILYGEGATKAFRRLQEEIIRTSFDQSIFVWRGNYMSSGLFAKSPADFANTPPLGPWGARNLSPFTMTNVGLSLRLNITKVRENDTEWLPQNIAYNTHLAVVACDVWNGGEWTLLVLYVQPVPASSFHVNGKTCRAYRRVKCDTWIEVPAELLTGRTGPSLFEDILVLEDEHFDLVNWVNQEDMDRADAITQKHLEL